jgi:hypothetical protein
MGFNSGLKGLKQTTAWLNVTIIQDKTDNLSRNVSKKMPFYGTENHKKRAQISCTKLHHVHVANNAIFIRYKCLP